jgi:predicted transcriptional regulator of viral defense system
MPEPCESTVLQQQQIAAAQEEWHPDRAIAALAARQHGVVARRQLLAAGLSPEMLRGRIRSQRLLLLHRGVYAVGHARLTRDGHRVAALHAAGPGAALSHREAGALHALLPSGVRMEVTTPNQRRVPGIVVYRARLDRADVTTVDGLPVTTVARTLVDLAGVVPRERLRKTLEEAERSHRLDVRAIEAVLARTRGRNGSGHERIRHGLTELAATGTSITRSMLERGFLALLDAHALPRPTTNAWAEAMEVDAVWPAVRLAVELDGWNAHKTRDAFQRDRTRSNDLQAAGWTILRFTHADVVHRPDETAARLARVLAQAAAATG